MRLVASPFQHDLNFPMMVCLAGSVLIIAKLAWGISESEVVKQIPWWRFDPNLVTVGPADQPLECRLPLTCTQIICYVLLFDCMQFHGGTGY